MEPQLTLIPKTLRKVKVPKITSERKQILVGRRVLLSTTAGSCYCHVIKFIGFNRIKIQMSNMHKTINYNKVSGGRNSNNVVCEFATDNGDHTTS